MGDAFFTELAAIVGHDAQLMMCLTPVNPGERRPLGVDVVHCFVVLSSGPHRLMATFPGAHSGARSTTPTGRSRSATAGRNGSAAGPSRSRCQGRRPAEVTTGRIAPRRS